MGEKIRLYQFNNFQTCKHGEPFALCDRHGAEQVMPSNCVLTKIADKAISGCRACRDEVNQKYPEEAAGD